MCQNNSGKLPPQFWADVENGLQVHSGKSAAEAAQLVKNIRAIKQTPAFLAIRTAQANKSANSAKAENIISRALVLLRLSSLIAKRNADEAEKILGPGTLVSKAYVLDAYSLAAQLIPIGSNYAQILSPSQQELLAFQEFDKYLASAPASVCGNAMWAQIGRELIELLNIERVCVRAYA